MDAARRVRRKPLPRPDTGYNELCWPVGPLYLEDSEDIYDAMDTAVGDLKANREQEIEWWEGRAADRKGSRKRWEAHNAEMAELGVEVDPLRGAIFTQPTDVNIPEHVYEPVIRLARIIHQGPGRAARARHQTSLG